VNDQQIFRIRKRPDGTRPNAADEPMPTKRLRGLDEFVKPAFVGRMAQIERRRKWAWYAMLGAAVAMGMGIGLVMF
jgi:hypothetical protein